MREMVDKPAMPRGAAKISQMVMMMGVDAKADKVGHMVVRVVGKEGNEWISLISLLVGDNVVVVQDYMVVVQDYVVVEFMPGWVFFAVRISLISLFAAE